MKIKELTNSDLQGDLYGMLYEILGTMSLAERKSIFEHVIREDFPYRPDKKKQLKCSLVWRIYKKYKTEKLYLLAFDKNVTKF